jgi:hypothetical protein
MKKLAVASALFLALVLDGNAAVVNSVDVNGLKTFTDSNTGRVWLDMDNFFDASANNGTSGVDMITIANNAGFTFATKSDVEQLLGALPLGNGEWSSYASVMGFGIPRQLIWGMYDDGGDNSVVGWAWAWNGDSAWNVYDNIGSTAGVQNAGSAGAVDLGIWAYQSGTVPVAQTPIPAAVWLFGSALTGLFGFGKRKKA